MSGVAMTRSKSILPPSTSVGEVVGTDDVGAGGAGLVGSFARGEHGDANVLAGTRRQCDGATDHLVGLAGVDAEADRDVDAFVELRRRHRLDEPDRLDRAVELVPIELLERVCVLLA